MDFYGDAVAILEAIVRGLHGQDFFGWLRFGKRKKQFLEKKNGVALLPVKNRYLCLPDSGGAGRKVKPWHIIIKNNQERKRNCIGLGGLLTNRQFSFLCAIQK